MPDSADPPRLLHRRLGYTERVDQALPNEPEAVSEREQEAMSKRARDAERARARAAWKDASAQITDAVATFRARSGHVPPAVANGTRVVLRAAEMVGRRLQA